MHYYVVDVIAGIDMTGPIDKQCMAENALDDIKHKHKNSLFGIECRFTSICKKQ